MFGNVISEIAKTRKRGIGIIKIIKSLLKENSKLIISQSNPYKFDIKDMDWKSEEERRGVVYKTRYKAIKYNNKENQTTSQETVDMFMGGKLIKSIISPPCVQKWWYPEELEQTLKENGFTEVEIVNSKGRAFTKTSSDYIIIAKRL